MHLHVFGALGSKRDNSWQVFSYAQVHPEWCLFVEPELWLALCRVKGWSLNEAGRERPGPLPAPVVWNRSWASLKSLLFMSGRRVVRSLCVSPSSYSWKTPSGSP